MVDIRDRYNAYSWLSGWPRFSCGLSYQKGSDCFSWVPDAVQVSSIGLWPSRYTWSLMQFSLFFQSHFGHLHNGFALVVDAVHASSISLWPSTQSLRIGRWCRSCLFNLIMAIYTMASHVSFAFAIGPFGPTCSHNDSHTVYHKISNVATKCTM